MVNAGLVSWYPLDMAQKAFDDQYQGCTIEMQSRAYYLLQTDLKENKMFKSAWEKAEQRWMQIKNNIRYTIDDYFGTALVAYTGDKDLAREFNKNVREFCKNAKNFHFKAFHYYLTRALQYLNSGKCFTVYRGTKNAFWYSGSGRTRFGQFTSSSLSRPQANNFRGNSGTLFTIKTCLGVHIQDFSKFPEEQEVLIPGYEVYDKITQEHNEITLENPQKVTSNFNCFYLYSDNPALPQCNSSGMMESSMFLLLLLLLLPSLVLPLLFPAEL